ncbi:sigma-70 family RNA polymerase sigma factor [Mycolicibacterium austroafricanum]|uniref:sigma-70 family RNA polymerase sigma factor n=1 Tax=Mycolicibacterium austroafricanum TaxID=39687 RepID=UPI00300F9848
MGRRCAVRAYQPRIPMTLAAEPPESHGGKAQGERFRRHVEPEIELLLRVARTLVGPVDAEDLVQETLLRAWRAMDRFDGRYPRAWLMTILKNTNMNMQRRRQPHSLDDVDSYAGATPAFGVIPPSTEDQIMSVFLPDDLHNAVQSLDTKFRSVLLLVDVDDLSYAEAAEALGVPLGTVMSRLHRARKRVRHYLRPKFVASTVENRT